MPATPSALTAPALISSGVPGLDAVLGGGFSVHRFYLIEGVPGSGKTTLALQFLLEGVKRDESVLYISLSETEEEIRAVAHSHGWPLEGVRLLEVVASEQVLAPEQQYTVFQPDEVELSETTKAILKEVETYRPARVVFDSLSELRMLASSPLRYRRQMLGLKQFFAGRQCTVLVLDDRTSAADDPQLQSIAHGVISLEHMTSIYGAQRRRLRVVKYRGVSFAGGNHDFKIMRGGLQVYPRLVALEQRGRGAGGALSSGVAELDALLGGGLERGTSTLLAGAAGTGKSSIALQFAVAAARRGECAAAFLFDESVTTLRKRMLGMGIDIDALTASGRLTLRQVDPAELSPGEFAHLVREAAERPNTSVIVIDSLNGYMNAMPDDKLLNVQLHELLTCLGQLDVATLLISVQHGLVGTHVMSTVDASYLADTVVVLRYFEANAAVRQAISVLKKRSGPHERTIREFTLSSSGVRVGPPLEQFHGVLTGIPRHLGADHSLPPHEELE
jgi:circadian clock protein KaiC